MERKKTWWRYPLAIIAFLVSYFLAAMIVYVVMYYLQIITPRFYKSDEMWVWFVAFMFGSYMGFEVAAGIMGSKKWFATGLSVAFAIYVIITGIFNGIAWGYFPDSTLAYIISGITTIAVHVYRVIKEHKKSKDQNT